MFPVTLHHGKTLSPKEPMAEAVASVLGSQRYPGIHFSAGPAGNPGSTVKTAAA